MASTPSQPPFTYNLAEFMSRDIEIDLALIPEYETESAAARLDTGRGTSSKSPADGSGSSASFRPTAASEPASRTASSAPTSIARAAGKQWTGIYGNRNAPRLSRRIAIDNRIEGPHTHLRRQPENLRSVGSAVTRAQYRRCSVDLIRLEWTRRYQV